MGNKSSSPSQVPPNVLGSGFSSKNVRKYGSNCHTAPFISQSYGASIFHQSADSLHHFSGTDSGYMTSPADSERWKTNKWKIANSRLSLNESSFMDGPPGVPPTIPSMPTLLHIPPPTLKQFKKWQKKQKKLLKKMNFVPANLILSHAPITPLSQYSRAFSVDNLSRKLDGYIDVSLRQNHIWRQYRKVPKNQVYGNTASDIPPGQPKSSLNSSCFNGFALSDLRPSSHSAPSTNTSDWSCLPSTTDHSSALHHQTSSPVQLKNSSNQHLQRMRVSKNDTGLIGTPRRLQQWNLVAKGESLVTVQHGITKVVADETSEFRKCELGQKSSDVIHACRKTAANKERSYRYRNDISDSTNANKSSQHNDLNADNDSDIIPEASISVRVTQAEKAQEKNFHLFSKNVINSPNDDKVFSTDETALNPFQRYNSISGTATQNNSLEQTHLGYFSPKKSADYGSTISSLTQSSNMKTEVSDIDFSWVNDVEKRLEREIACVRKDSRQKLQRQQQLPVQYFGMDLEQSKVAEDRAVMVVSPVHATPTKSLQVFGECESRKGLSEIHSDVRSKAAVFDMETSRKEQKVVEQQAIHGNVYIPQPDRRPVVDVSTYSSRSHSVSYSLFDFQERGIIKLNGNFTGITAKYGNSYYSNGNGKVFKQRQQQQQQKQQQQPYSRYKDHIAQRHRRYDATECYIQNVTRGSTDKPRRISVAY